MPARNPRVNVVLEEPLFDTLKRLARRDKLSVSSKVRDLISRALEAEEDAALADLAEQRERTFNRKKAFSHRQAWGRSSNRR